MEKVRPGTGREAALGYVRFGWLTYAHYENDVRLNNHPKI